MDVSIRTFNVDDIPFALEQTRREGWDTTNDLFDVCLENDSHGCFVAESGGRSVGLITTTRHTHTGWIGNLIVSPDARSRGVGRVLMRCAIARLESENISTIRLEADPPGVPLYRSLGFVEEYETPRFLRGASRCAETRECDAIQPRDLSQIADFDAAYFGDDRGRLLAALHRQARATCLVRDGGKLRGYAFAVPSLFGARIGPCVAADAATAESLLTSLLADLAGDDVILAAPAPNRAAGPLLESLGFREQPSCLRMVLGERACSGQPEFIYSLANGAMG